MASQGWGPIPSLLAELQRQLGACYSESLQKEWAYVQAVAPLGRFLMLVHSSSSDECTAAAVATVRAILSSPLLISRHLGSQSIGLLFEKLSQWLFVTCSGSPALMGAIHKAVKFGRRDGCHSSPLVLACGLGDVRAVRYLLRHTKQSMTKQCDVSVRWIEAVPLDIFTRSACPITALLLGSAQVTEARRSREEGADWCGVLDDLVAAGANVSDFLLKCETDNSGCRQVVLRCFGDPSSAAWAVVCRLLQHGAKPPAWITPDTPTRLTQRTYHNWRLHRLRQDEGDGMLLIGLGEVVKVTVTQQTLNDLLTHAAWARRKHAMALRERLRDEEDY